MEAENDTLRVIVEEQAALIEEVPSRLDGLTARLGKDFSNSSLPPSRDSADRRAAERAEANATNKLLGKAARASRKQEGIPFHPAPESSIASRCTPPETCIDCGASRTETPVGEANRQVPEIPIHAWRWSIIAVRRRRCSCGERPGRSSARGDGTGVLGAESQGDGRPPDRPAAPPLERAGETMAVLFDAPIGEGLREQFQGVSTALGPDLQIAFPTLFQSIRTGNQSQDRRSADDPHVLVVDRSGAMWQILTGVGPGTGPTLRFPGSLGPRHASRTQFGI